MRKRILTTTLVILGAGFALTSTTRIFSRSKPAHPPIVPRGQIQDAQALPEHVPYMFLFHHLVFLKQKADEFEQQGRGTSSLLTRFQEDTKLTDEQFRALYQIASDCERQVAEQDKKAMDLINKMKEPYPDGRLPEGKAPPPLPSELIRLQQDRDAIVLRARDRVRQALGEQAFTQFHAFVQARVAPEIKPDINQ